LKAAPYNTYYYTYCQGYTSDKDEWYNLWRAFEKPALVDHIDNPSDSEEARVQVYTDYTGYSRSPDRCTNNA
jgi:hypothetical protein